MSTFIWNETLEEQLVDHVEPIASLWDKRKSLYSNTELNLKYWNRIGRVLGCTAESACHRFKLLKRRYVRYLSKRESDKKNGFETQRKPFLLAKKMAFLKPALTGRPAVESICFNIKDAILDSTSNTFGTFNTSFQSVAATSLAQAPNTCSVKLFRADTPKTINTRSSSLLSDDNPPMSPTTGDEEVLLQPTQQIGLLESRQKAFAAIRAAAERINILISAPAGTTVSEEQLLQVSQLRGGLENSQNALAAIASAADRIGRQEPVKKIERPTYLERNGMLQFPDTHGISTFPDPHSVPTFADTHGTPTFAEKNERTFGEIIDRPTSPNDYSSSKMKRFRSFMDIALNSLDDEEHDEFMDGVLQVYLDIKRSRRN